MKLITVHERARLELELPRKIVRANTLEVWT